MIYESSYIFITARCRPWPRAIAYNNFKPNEQAEFGERQVVLQEQCTFITYANSVHDLAPEAFAC